METDVEAGLLGLTLSLPLGITDPVPGRGGGGLLDPPSVDVLELLWGFLCFLKYVLTKKAF